MEFGLHITTASLSSYAPEREKAGMTTIFTANQKAPAPDSTPS